jgi:hypothetical protein
MNKNDKEETPLEMIPSQRTDQESDDVIEQLSESDPGDPINPVRGLPLKVRQKSSAYAFYREIRGQLRDWWDEFNSRMDDDGKLYYRTIIKFARGKGKTRLEQELILEMIGPKPELKPGRAQLRVPWLGDWQRRRDNGFWCPRQRSHFRELARSFKERMVAWDVVRMTAPILIAEWARLEGRQEELDELFGGRQFDMNQSPTGSVNEKRFQTYWAFQSKILANKIEVFHEFMKANGLNPDDPVQLMQVNTLSAQLNSPGGDTGVFAEASLLKEEFALLKVAKMLQQHAKTCNLPLPRQLLGNESDPGQESVDAEQQAVTKGNAKLQ